MGSYFSDELSQLTIDGRESGIKRPLENRLRGCELEWDGSLAGWNFCDGGDESPSPLQQGTSLMMHN